MSSTEYWNQLVPELTVSDVEASLRFYLCVGFKIRFRRNNGHEFVYIEQGEAQFMLSQQHESAWNIGPFEHPLGRGINFQIEVPDAYAVATKLHEAGFPLFQEPTESWYAVSALQEEGQLELLAQDPDGYLMRFAQALGAREIRLT